VLSRLRKHLPRAEVVTIDRAGHLLLEEQPEASNAAIRRFLTVRPDTPAGERPTVDIGQPAS
jgi:pimeloyl-ACP methyl ester carboxylesterase